MEFHTHDGELVTGERLAQARSQAAEDWRKLCYAIREEDAYASHVTEAQKDRILADGLAQADALESGEAIGSFTFWQRVNQKLTGVSASLLA